MYLSESHRNGTNIFQWYKLIVCRLSRRAVVAQYLTSTLTLAHNIPPWHTFTYTLNGVHFLSPWDAMQKDEGLLRPRGNSTSHKKLVTITHEISIVNVNAIVNAAVEYVRQVVAMMPYRIIHIFSGQCEFGVMAVPHLWFCWVRTILYCRHLRLHSWREKKTLPPSFSSLLHCGQRLQHLTFGHLDDGWWKHVLLRLLYQS